MNLIHPEIPAAELLGEREFDRLYHVVDQAATARGGLTWAERRLVNYVDGRIIEHGRHVPLTRRQRAALDAIGARLP